MCGRVALVTPRGHSAARYFDVRLSVTDVQCHSSIGCMTPHSVHYGLAADLRVIRQATLDAAFLVNPNRFKNKRPLLPRMPTAAWINPPPEKKTPTSKAVARLN